MNGTLALLFHDVVDEGNEDSSGPAGRLAARFKISPELFRRHMEVIRESGSGEPGTIGYPGKDDGDEELPDLVLTVDDGGRSSLAIASVLEKYGWRGHFFVTTCWIGEPGFLDRGNIRDLHRRGHVIGSHSATHPLRISTLSRDDLLREWRDSCRELSEILQGRVRAASVPGGYYSPQVGECAAEAGISYLFTSEPTTRVSRMGDCTILGRFSVTNDTPACTVARILDGRRAPLVRKLASWKIKRAAKGLLGDRYFSVREQILKMLRVSR